MSPTIAAKTWPMLIATSWIVANVLKIAHRIIVASLDASSSEKARKASRL
ncbi:MAG: hypothetical protein ACK4SY_08650 [Pyrobaculum sp.]